MKNFRLHLIFLLPLVASFFPYLACHFFDAPLAHGLLNFDIFVFALLCCLPYGKLLWKLAFAILAFIFAFIGNDIGYYLTGTIYLLAILIFSLFRNKRKFLCASFFLFSLFAIVSDWGEFFYSAFGLNLMDVWGLAKFYWWGILLFLLTPTLQLALLFLFSRKILWSKNCVQIPHFTALLILLSAFFIHFFISLIQARQPIFDFPIKNFMWQTFTPGQITHNSILQEDIKKVFPIYEGPHIVANTARPTIVILMESFGVNKNIDFMKMNFEFFREAKITFSGLYARTAAHTQGSEWEDFNMPGGDSSNTSLAFLFRKQGFETWYLHGYDAKFYDRNKLYAKSVYGFVSLLFKEDFTSRGRKVCANGLTGICDAEIAKFIDSLLIAGTNKFVYWTTLDAHPPYEKASIAKPSKYCEELSLSDVECTYVSLQESTAKIIVELANKHPEYQFVIRGDHRPALSFEQTDFIQSFYYRWVPLVILN